MTRAKAWALMIVLAGCDATAAVEEVALRNPLLDIDRDIDKTPWSGVVTERIDGGGYGYLRVGEPGRWVVGLDRGLDVGDRVDVRPVGVAEDFESRRTGRRFETLWFAVVQSSNTSP